MTGQGNQGLRERLEAGELSREQVQFAVWLGDLEANTLFPEEKTAPELKGPRRRYCSCDQASFHGLLADLVLGRDSEVLRQGPCTLFGILDEEAYEAHYDGEDFGAFETYPTVRDAMEKLLAQPWNSEGIPEWAEEYQGWADAVLGFEALFLGMEENELGSEWCACAFQESENFQGLQRERPNERFVLGWEAYATASEMWFLGLLLPLNKENRASTGGYKNLITAVRACDSEAVLGLLEEGADPNEWVRDRYTDQRDSVLRFAIREAAQSSCEEVFSLRKCILKALLEHGADPLLPAGPNENTPLVMVFEAGTLIRVDFDRDLQIFEALLEAGADIHGQSLEGATLLHDATRLNFPRIAARLRDLGLTQ